MAGLLLVPAGCAGGATDLGTTAVREPVAAVSSTVPPSTPAPPATTIPRSALAALVVPAGSTLFDPTPTVAPAAPTGVTVDGIGVRTAPVVGVGVDAQGAFAVPAVDQVGWYRFGPRPGDAGSAVLAAHIAFDGVDGVFRRLASVRVGAAVTVSFADATTRRFTVTSIERIDKDELPPELFAVTGPAQLVLITCGGAFDRDRRSYEDNIVVRAEPVP